MVPRSADLSLKLGQAGRAALPFVPGGISVAALTADVGLDAGDAAPWKATVKAEGVEGAFGRVDGVALDASGQAHGPCAAERARARASASMRRRTGVVPTDLALARRARPDLQGERRRHPGRPDSPVTFEDLERSS